MKIIFLDIDGVLIRFGDTPQIRKTRAEKRQGGIISEFDEDLVDNLKTIIKETGCKIVISSSWRHQMDRVRTAFKIAGLPLDSILGITPDGLGYGRGNEILTFINDYHRTCGAGMFIRSWVAIDDDSFDMKRINRLGLLVKTETHEGLTKEKAKEVILILNKQ